MDTGEFLGILGIYFTILIGVLFFILTSVVINKIDIMVKRLNGMLIAPMSMDEYKNAIKLIDDFVKTGEKRGVIEKNDDGTYTVKWIIVM